MWRLALVCLAACGFQITSGRPDAADGRGPDDAQLDTEPPHWLAGYAYRKRIAVTSGQSIDLSDFVVGVVIPGDPDLAASARDDGQDLVFTAADDTILDYEIERFDGATGALAAWVEVPTLASSTTLYVYYGGEPRTHDARATWPAATYRAVWHLSDQAGTAAKDSAGSHDLASSGGQNQPVNQEGLVGSARGFDGSNDSLRDNADDDTLDFGTGSFSYSAWVLVAQSAGDFDMPLYKGGASAGQRGFDMELGRGGWRALISDGTTNGVATFTTETLNAWVHLTAVCDRATQRLRVYKDGVQQEAIDISSLGSLSSNDALVIGSSTDGNYWFRGRIEEVRINPRALAPEWIAAEHANIRSPSTFAAVGPTETAP